MPDATSAALLSVTQASKTFAGQVAVANASLTLAAGEILVIVGPSGSGKSTLLKLIAGFEDMDCGTVALKGRRVDHLPPEQRQIGMVFQDYALFPHMTVLQNVMFAAHRQPAAMRRQTALGYLDMLGMGAFVQRYPHQLSGGQQQRVAVARTLASAAQLVLLDEPFSSIDESMRAHARQEIRSILRQSGLGAIMVTHDCMEALSFADRICVMNQGEVVQTGTPEDIYHRPTNAFVAGFVAPTNLFPARIENGIVQFALGTIALDAHRYHLAAPRVSIRPEALAIGTGDTCSVHESGAGRGSLGVVEAVEFRGDCYFFTVLVDQQRCVVRSTDQPRFVPGDIVSVGVRQMDSLVVF